jgi:protein SCO1/2
MMIKNNKHTMTTVFISLMFILFVSMVNAGQIKLLDTVGKSTTQTSKEKKQKARDYFSDTVLINQHGKKVRFYTDVLDDRIILLNVMYTSCKGSCPLMTKKLTHVRNGLGSRFGKEIFFASLSNNPKEDTPAALAKFAKKQHAVDKGWSFLTGKKDNITKIVKKMGFYTQRFEEHSALLVAGNTRTGHWIKIKPSTPLEGIILKLTQLADEG